MQLREKTTIENNINHTHCMTLTHAHQNRNMPLVEQILLLKTVLSEKSSFDSEWSRKNC